jgi:hypothetical protein
MYTGLHVKCPLFLSELDFSGRIFDKYSHTTFRENPSIGDRVVPHGRTERQKDTKLIIAFRNFANAPKKGKLLNVCVQTDQFSWWLLDLHRSITLVDLQLDAQKAYLFTYNTFIKILYMFRALPFSSSGLRRNCIYTVSGIVTLCRWLSFAPVKKEVLS